MEYSRTTWLQALVNQVIDGSHQEFMQDVKEGEESRAPEVQGTFKLLCMFINHDLSTQHLEN